MKHFYNHLRSFVLGVICFLPFLSEAQLNVNSAASAQDLANAIVGSGVTVSNVVLDCGPGGTGIFSNGVTTNVGLNDGIVLTSGRAIDAIGPNNIGNLTFNQPSTYNGDADLSTLVSGSIQDACRLEFDFIAESDFITVQYVFGSEEYNEYVCSQFNDVFGFFVNGPKPAGGNYNGQNVALVPSTSLPVSVNTINNGSSGSQGSPSNCVSLLYSALYQNNAGGLTIQYDGFTVILTAEVAVVPGESYHFKFAIADVNDSNLDSGVFIKSQSFSIFNCQAGTLSIADDIVLPLCVNDDNADLVQVYTNSTATGDTYVFALVDADGNILELNATGSFDLSSYAIGNYRICGISYDGEVSGIEVGENVSDISVVENEGCFDISSIDFSKEGCTVFELISCASDITLECGSDLSDLYLTGMPVVEIQYPGDIELIITHIDSYEANGPCGGTVTRTWTISFGDQVEMCTQIITLLDTVGPVISGVETPINVQCLEDVPAPSAATALDACSGEAEVEVFTSETGNISEECDLSTAVGPGADWSLWLPVLASNSQVTTANFVFDSNGGHFDQFNDGTAHIYGTVVNSSNSNEQFIVDLWLENKADWTTWSSMGRNYKDDLGYAQPNHYTNWSYYELVGGFSTLTGAGDLAGDVLYIYHMPANYYFGFQVGQGANNKNGNYGLSGWFTYDGFVDGSSVAGHGDVNTDAECEPGGENNTCPNTEFTNFYRAEDACGHATVVAQIITVEDTIAPTFDNCPESLTIECSDAIPAVAEGVTATDNCIGDVTVLYLGEEAAGDQCETILTRTWVADDACGNRSSCVQTITILDTTAPVLSGLPLSEVTVECDAVPAPADVTVSDNCDETVTVEFLQEIVDGNCPGNYTIVRTWSSYDICDNYVSFTQTINVEDTTAPVFDAYEYYAHIECNEIPDLLTATDNCGEVTVELVSEVLNSGGCLGVYYRVYKATDDCGNSVTAEQYIAIQDHTAPELVGVPADETVECSSVWQMENGNYFDNGGVYGVDNCEMEVTVTYSEEVVLTDDNCPQSYDIIRTWVGVDYCENDTTMSQTVHVVDTTAPGFEYVPYGYQISCEEVPTYDMAYAYDNCGEVTIEESVDTIAGDCPQSYDIVRTFIATDECGNVSEPVTQVIEVRDYTAPTFGGDQEVFYVYECDEVIPVTTPSATDNCGEVSLTYVDTLGQKQGCDSAFYRLWIATDECSNMNYFVQLIYITDTTAPVIAGEFEIELPCDDYAGIYVTATDNCQTEITFDSYDEHVSGACAGKIIRHYFAYDGCGNVSEEFTQIITLIDEVAPVVEFEDADQTVECGDQWGVEPAQFSDNCDPELEIVSDIDTAMVDCATIYTYTWTATDHCNNSTTATTVVTIIDTVNPYFVEFPYDVTINCQDELPAVVYPLAADACDEEVEVTFATETFPGNCPNEKIVKYIFRAVDDCGNAIVQAQTITVVDEEAPMFDYDQQYYYTYECDETIELIQPAATDNCGEVSYTHEDIQAWTDGCYSGFTRVWTATDECDNSSTFYQSIYVQDTKAPVVDPFTIEVSMPCDQISDAVLITAQDNCNDVIITFEDEGVSGQCQGKIIRTYHISDICGNVTPGLYQQIITLIDNVAPTVEELPVDLVVECGDAIPEYVPVWSDNCASYEDLTLTAMSSIGFDGCNQIINTSWSATDNCNNTTTVSRIVTIVDTTAPEFTYVPENATYECDELYALEDAIATDVCDSEVEVTSEVVETPGDCPAERILTITFTASDDCGNTATAQQVITIEDTTAPAFDYNEDNMYFSYQCLDEVEVVEPSATDACSTFELTYTDELSNDGDCYYSIIRTWVATDACGNSSYFVQDINVYDYTAPVIETELADVYVECVSEIPAAVEVVATDNCDDDVTVEVTPTVIESDDCGNQIIEVSYVATDNCGNTDYASYYIYVYDETAPVFTSCPADLVLACDDEIPAGENMIAYDNCGAEIVATPEDIIHGEMPAQGSIADCDLLTPVRPAGNPCNYPYDWAMILIGMPNAHKWYSVSEGNFVQYPNGSIHITATLNNVLNPSNGWLLDVTFNGQMDWATWSALGRSFKDDCGGIGANHPDWLYYLLQSGAGAELVGFGGYAGSALDMQHTPANLYFGFQLGDGANNYNGADHSFGGWFKYSGTFRPNQNSDLVSVSASGDLAFEMDCCPDYWIERQWTASDCTGNTVYCTQTISFEGSDLNDNISVISTDKPLVAKGSDNAQPTVGVYPNPASDNATFTFKTVEAGQTRLEIFDMSGSKVADVYNSIATASTEYVVNFDASKLATGVYMFRLTNGSATEMGRVIISK